jgi:hypothetical protein
MSAAGEKLIAARIEEQGEAETLLAHLEEIDVRGDAFRDAFVPFRRDVLEHVRREEGTVFGLIEQDKTLDERAHMARRYETAKKLSPTHPHPHAPHHPPGNLIVGPVAALGDRIRDAFRAVDL